MRIWSLHPKYLDSKGLVALWRETLLAKNVLEGKTRGYKNHPQLNRFKKSKNPYNSINQYLALVYDEAVKRNYNFSKDKVDWDFFSVSLTVTKGQLDFEKAHLLKKLKVRDEYRYNVLKNLVDVDTHPLFNIIKGEIEEWEIMEKVN